MLVLLPPSEGKATPARGAPLDLDALSFPSLGAQRARVLDALVALAGRDDAAAVLGLSPGLAPLAAANADLRRAPTARASAVFDGVLYDALDLAHLPRGARARAASSIVIVSALFGLLRPGDRIPAYRLAMDVDLPGVGPLAAAWRPVLAPVLEEAARTGLVVDCRSATYAAAWRPPAPIAARTVHVRVLEERPTGERVVVSHWAKETRGRVTRHLLLARRAPKTPEALPAALGDAFRTELVAPARTGGTWTLDVLVDPR